MIEIYGYSSDEFDFIIIPKKNKSKISKALREKVYRRDNYTCLKCKCTDRSKLTCDHIQPRAFGGKNTYTNLQTLCERCNSLKGTKNIKYLKKKNTRKKK